MASAAGLPACFLISPTALPLVGSISKRRRSQRKMTFSHFSIGSRPLGFESQNHIAIKKPPQGRFFYGVSGGTSRLFSNFADSAAACRLNKQTAPLTTKSDIQSLFYRFAPSRVRVPKSYCHKKNRRKDGFFYGVSGGTSRLFSNFADSAAACRLNKQTAPLTTKSDIQSLFYRFAPSRVRVPKSYCHKKTAARTVFFMASAAGLEPTAPGLGNLCSILMSYADLKQERIITALFTKSIILRHLSTISDWPPRF